jgi:drug/metabolite transporter (DMT)-like permease
VVGMRHSTAYAILVVTTLSWGGNAVAGKIAVGHISPMLLTSARWVFSAAILLILGWGHLKRDWPLIRRNLPLLVLLGALGFASFNILLYSALAYTSAINVSIEQAGIPLVIFVANFLLFRLRVTALQLAGFGLTLLGVALAASHGELSRLFELDINLGDGMMLIAVILYGGYSVALRYKPNIHWMSMLIVLCTAAFVLSVPPTIGEFAYGAGIMPDAIGWGMIIFAVIGPSIVSQALYIRGVEMIGANRAGLFINLVPVFGVLLALLFLGEPLQAWHVLALALALGGIALAEWSGRRVAARAAGSAQA